MESSPRTSKGSEVRHPLLEATSQVTFVAFYQINSDLGGERYLATVMEMSSSVGGQVIAIVYAYIHFSDFFFLISDLTGQRA